jgi:chloride channel 3/4/5
MKMPLHAHARTRLLTLTHSLSVSVSVSVSLSVCIGFTIGTVAAAIDIWHYWLADLRIGYCSLGWALNRHFCCWNTAGT